MSKKMLRSVPVPLSEYERAQYGLNLANLLGSFDELLEENKGKRAKLKEEEDKIETEIQRVAEVLRSGKEEREVDVDEVQDHETLKVLLRETGTGRILLTRDMTEFERVNSRLPFDSTAAHIEEPEHREEE